MIFQDLTSVTAERALAEVTGVLSVSSVKALGVKMENAFATVVSLATLITICHRVIASVFNCNTYCLLQEEHSTRSQENVILLSYLQQYIQPLSFTSIVSLLIGYLNDVWKFIEAYDFL